MPESHEPEPIAFYPRVRFLVGNAFAGLALFGAGYASLISALEADVSRTPVGQGVGGLSLGVLGALLFSLSVSHLIRRRPILSITASGIQGSGGLSGTGMFIAWDEMTAVRLKGSDVIIRLKNPDDVLSRAGPGRRILMRMNRLFYGTPAAIPGMFVTKSPAALADLIENRRVQAVMK